MLVSKQVARREIALFAFACSAALLRQTYTEELEPELTQHAGSFAGHRAETGCSMKECFFQEQSWIQSDAVKDANAHLVLDLAVKAGSVLLCIVDVDLLTRSNGKQLPVRAPRGTSDRAVIVHRLQGLS